MTEVRGRLAPSPTGALHLGNARTFLLAWLSIRAQGGAVVLRIEDLDGPRIKAGAEQGAIDDLRWLGLDWDEGPTDANDHGDGAHAPYRQTERIENYQIAIGRLVERGVVYPCICTRSEIESAASAPNAGDHETRYPGTCRGKYKNIDVAEQKSGRPAALRYLVNDGWLTFRDAFRGDCEFSPALECGDFVIEKVERAGPSAGARTPAYQLACVADDAAMNITEITRGDDLLSSTARQLILQNALGLPHPTWTHTPLLIGSDGRRLAKRHGDTTIRRFREAGVGADRLVGWLAAISGLVPAGSRAHARELVAGFSMNRVPRESVVVTAEAILNIFSL
ncbi:MAG: tRNA glutamyl-Q(34) synthetase GluQRS [Planctomycetes bacterium]|nr:tRNA glutamyl-Q(34) synthetase GluQRS [Planctomycetota bacterium]